MDRDEQIIGLMFLDGIQYTNGEVKLRWQPTLLICINKKVSRVQATNIKRCLYVWMQILSFDIFYFLSKFGSKVIDDKEVGKETLAFGKEKKYEVEEHKSKQTTKYN